LIQNNNKNLCFPISILAINKMAECWYDVDTVSSFSYCIAVSVIGLSLLLKFSYKNKKS